MQRRMPKVLTLEEAAAHLRSTPDEVLQEIQAGTLRGFRVGGRWQTTEEALLEFMGELSSHQVNELAAEDSGQSTESGGTMVAEKPSLSSVIWENVKWEAAPPFTYRWPSKPGEVVEEHFDEAYKAVLPLGDKKQPMLIGFTDREAAGMKNRRRAVVFLGEEPRLLAVVEFAGANDFDTSGLLVSVIKLPDGKHLKPGAVVPAEYAEMPLKVYNTVVVGPYAAGSVAVAAHKDDHNLMARHALIRARWKGWL